MKPRLPLQVFDGDVRFLSVWLDIASGVSYLSGSIAARELRPLQRRLQFLTMALLKELRCGNQ